LKSNDFTERFFIQGLGDFVEGLSADPKVAKVGFWVMGPDES